MKLRALERVLLMAIVIFLSTACAQASAPTADSRSIDVRAEITPAPFTDAPMPGTYEIQVYTEGQVQKATVSGASYALVMSDYQESARGLKVRLGSGLHIASLGTVQSSRHPAHKDIYTLIGSGTVSIERAR